MCAVWTWQLGTRLTAQLLIFPFFFFFSFGGCPPRPPRHGRDYGGTTEDGERGSDVDSKRPKPKVLDEQLGERSSLIHREKANRDSNLNPVTRDPRSPSRHTSAISMDSHSFPSYCIWPSRTAQVNGRRPNSGYLSTAHKLFNCEFPWVGRLQVFSGKARTQGRGVAMVGMRRS